MSKPYLHLVFEPIILSKRFIATYIQVLVLKERVLSFSGDSFDIIFGDRVPLLKITGTLLSVSGRKKVKDMDYNYLFNIYKEHMHVYTTYIMKNPSDNKICEIRSSYKYKNRYTQSHC